MRLELFDPLASDTSSPEPQPVLSEADVIHTLRDGRVVSLVECGSAHSWDGGTVSDAARRLACLLDDPERFDPTGAVLVLGAGCGLEGLVAATLGAHVLLTDKDLAVASPTLVANIERNGLSARVEVLTCDWELEGASAMLPARPIDVVCAADCVGHEDDIVPLLRTIHAVAHTSTVAYICGVVGGALSKSFVATSLRFFERVTAIILPEDAERGDETESHSSRTIHRISVPRRQLDRHGLSWLQSHQMGWSGGAALRIGPAESSTNPPTNQPTNQSVATEASSVAATASASAEGSASADHRGAGQAAEAGGRGEAHAACVGSGLGGLGELGGLGGRKGVHSTGFSSSAALPLGLEDLLPQATSDSRVGHLLGGRTWNAAHAMAYLLSRSEWREWLAVGRSIVELGAGATGVAGLAAAKFGGTRSTVALDGLSDIYLSERSLFEWHIEWLE